MKPRHLLRLLSPSFSFVPSSDLRSCYKSTVPLG